MVKFAVVLIRKPDTSAPEFRRYFRRVHGPLVERMPGLKNYVQNYVAALPWGAPRSFPRRPQPGWDGMAEL